MTPSYLREEFTEEFFEEFQYDAEFRQIWFAMQTGMTPYQAIEHLCKSKKAILKSLEQALAKATHENPRRFVVPKEDVIKSISDAGNKH